MGSRYITQRLYFILSVFSVHKSFSPNRMARPSLSIPELRYSSLSRLSESSLTGIRWSRKDSLTLLLSSICDVSLEETETKKILFRSGGSRQDFLLSADTLVGVRVSRISMLLVAFERRRQGRPQHRTRLRGLAGQTPTYERIGFKGKLYYMEMTKQRTLSLNWVRKFTKWWFHRHLFFVPSKSQRIGAGALAWEKVGCPVLSREKQDIWSRLRLSWARERMCAASCDLVSSLSIVHTIVS